MHLFWNDYKMFHRVITEVLFLLSKCLHNVLTMEEALLNPQNPREIEE